MTKLFIHNRYQQKNLATFCSSRRKVGATITGYAYDKFRTRCSQITIFSPHERKGDVTNRNPRFCGDARRYAGVYFFIHIARFCSSGTTRTTACADNRARPRRFPLWKERRVYTFSPPYRRKPRDAHHDTRHGALYRGGTYQG